MQYRIIKFPSDFSVGTLTFRDAGSRGDWTDSARAIGDVVVPSGKDVCLSTSPTLDFDPKILSALAPDALSVFEWVSTSKVSDAAIVHIQHLTRLRGLAFWETSIGNDSLWYIRHLSNLEWLDIGDTRITDDGLAYLSELSSLNYLTLLNDRITDAGLFHLQKLTEIGGIDLMGTSVTDDGVDVLSKLTSLKNLRIFETRISERGYRKLKSVLPNCRIRFYNPHCA